MQHHLYNLIRHLFRSNLSFFMAILNSEVVDIASIVIIILRNTEEPSSCKTSIIIY